MSSDQTSAIPDDDAERFAAAVGTGYAGDDAALARDLEVAAMLTAHRPALDPDPQARERARQRLWAALGESRSADAHRGESHRAEARDAATGGPRAS